MKQEVLLADSNKDILDFVRVLNNRNSINKYFCSVEKAGLRKILIAFIVSTNDRDLVLFDRIIGDLSPKNLQRIKNMLYPCQFRELKLRLSPKNYNLLVKNG